MTPLTRSPSRAYGILSPLRQIVAQVGLSYSCQRGGAMPSSDQPEPNTPNSSPFSRVVRWLLLVCRWLLLAWWKLFFFVIVGNYLPGGILALLQGGWGALGAYVTTWGFL